MTSFPLSFAAIIPVIGLASLIFHVWTIDVVGVVEIKQVESAADSISFITLDPVFAEAIDGRIVTLDDLPDKHFVDLTTAMPTPCQKDMAMTCCLVSVKLASLKGVHFLESDKPIVLTFKKTSWVGWGQTASCKTLI